MSERVYYFGVFTEVERSGEAQTSAWLRFLRFAQFAIDKGKGGEDAS